MEKEIWKSIIGYEGFYEISSYGNVKSLKRQINRVNGRPLNLTERILLAKKDGHGYRKVQLWRDDKHLSIRVHRIVAKHFLENTNNLNEVNHIDGNKVNNNFKNLEWCTPEHNQLEAKRLGLKKCSKVNMIKNGVTINTYESISSACKENNIDKSGIYRCLKGLYKQNRGFSWEYA
jgi:hypothetical protein